MAPAAIFSLVSVVTVFAAPQYFVQPSGYVQPPPLNGYSVPPNNFGLYGASSNPTGTFGPSSNPTGPFIPGSGGGGISSVPVISATATQSRVLVSRHMGCHFCICCNKTNNIGYVTGTIISNGGAGGGGATSGPTTNNEGPTCCGPNCCGGSAPSAGGSVSPPNFNRFNPGNTLPALRPDPTLNIRGNPFATGSISRTVFDPALNLVNGTSQGQISIPIPANYVNVNGGVASGPTTNGCDTPNPCSPPGPQPSRQPCGCPSPCQPSPCNPPPPTYSPAPTYSTPPTYSPPPTYGPVPTTTQPPAPCTPAPRPPCIYPAPCQSAQNPCGNPCPAPCGPCTQPCVPQPPQPQPPVPPTAYPPQPPVPFTPQPPLPPVANDYPTTASNQPPPPVTPFPTTTSTAPPSGDCCFVQIHGTVATFFCGCAVGPSGTCVDASSLPHCSSQVPNVPVNTANYPVGQLVLSCGDAVGKGYISQIPTQCGYINIPTAGPNPPPYSGDYATAKLPASSAVAAVSVLSTVVALGLVFFLSI